jgi:large subunit ribosomal protein L19
MAEQEQKTTDQPAVDLSYPEIVPGVQVKVHQEIVETSPKGEEKKRIQVFEGLVITRHHGHGPKAMITVRKESDGIGVEKIFPLNMPSIKKLELVKKFVVRRKNIAYMRRNKTVRMNEKV